MFTESIRAFARCRPESLREINDQRESIVKVNVSRGEVSITSNEVSKTFSFDDVFNSQASQKSVYDQVAFPIVNSVLQGYNGTILAYGQTGAGKTHTMQGIIDYEELKGITPRAFEQIFNRIESTPHKQFLVRVSFFEIHYEEVHDLLAKHPNTLEIRERPSSGAYVKELLSLPVENVADAYQKLLTGNQNRIPGLTQMGQICSTSHSIFSITVECCETGPDGENHIKMGTLNLVDLAGSETRNRIKTAGHSMNINKSLINLGNVIYALSSSKSIHIPYKDSNLTRLLQDSLGGNAKTVLIANIGPADFNFEETLHTLRFANKVKTIKNKPKINDDQPCSFLREFQEYIEGLKVRLKEKEETIDRERKMIEVEKDLPDVDRARLLGDLAMPEEARKANQEHERISIRLKKLEKYVLKGSEAREYAYKQQEGMENLRKELEEKRLKEQQYARITDEQDIWKFSLRTTQDEINEKTREICKLSCKLERGKTELQELQDDFGEEKASYLQQISMLNSQLKLKDLVINYFIPQDVVAKTEAKSIWGQQEEDWILLSQDSLMKPQSSLKFTRPVSDCTGKKHSSPDWRYKSENIHDVVYDDDEKEKEMDKSQIDEKTRKLTYAPKRAGFDKKKREDSPNKEEEKITALSYDDYF